MDSGEYCKFRRLESGHHFKAVFKVRYTASAQLTSCRRAIPAITAKNLTMKIFSTQIEFVPGTNISNLDAFIMAAVVLVFFGGLLVCMYKDRHSGKKSAQPYNHVK